MIRPLRESLREFARDQMKQAILLTGSVSKAAYLLDVHRNTIYYELRKEIKGPITTRELRRQYRMKFAQTARQRSAPTY